MLSKIRPYGRLVNWCRGIAYDFKRFYSFGGWKIDLNNKEQRSYYAVKVYHGLEKSLSFTDRNPNSGWTNAFLLTNVLDYAIKNNNISFHDRIGLSVLRQFLDIQTDKTSPNYIKLAKKINDYNSYIDALDEIESGVIEIKGEELTNSKLDNPENFFNSRYTVREFSDTKVNSDDLLRAIKLSLKTPSACNRQPWHVYHLSKESSVKMALSCQTGNRGFEHKIQDLLIVCSDLRAFNPGSERYQHWIDGGMYAMSLTYTLHSLGISSCCLNWSQMGSGDKKLRNLFPMIDSSHSVIMMLAIGYPDKNNKLCVSPRRPLDEIITSDIE